MREKFRTFVLSVFVVLAVGFALGAAARSADPVVQAQARQLDFHHSEPACMEHHYRCDRGATATLLAQPAALSTLPAAGSVKFSARLAVPARETLPHRAASLWVLYCNFRE